MNQYDVLFLAFDLIDRGLNYRAIKQQLADEKAKGMPESEIPAFLRKLRDEAINEAQKEIDKMG